MFWTRGMCSREGLSPGPPLLTPGRTTKQGLFCFRGTSRTLTTLKRVGRLLISGVLILSGGVPLGASRTLSDLVHSEQAQEADKRRA